MIRILCSTSRYHFYETILRFCNVIPKMFFFLKEAISFLRLLFYDQLKVLFAGPYYDFAINSEMFKFEKEGILR